MIDEIFEVEHNDFIGFRDQLKRESYRMEKEGNALNYYSLKTGKLLCAQVEQEDGSMKHYVVEMPDDDERRPPLRKLQVELQSKEEVERFFRLVSEMMAEREKKKNG